MNQVQKGQGSEQLKNLSKPGSHVSQGFTARVIVFQQLSAFVSRFRTRESSWGHKLTLWLREGLALNWQSHQATFCRVEVISPKEMGCCCYDNRELLYHQKVTMSTTGSVITISEYLERGETWHGCRVVVGTPRGCFLCFLEEEHSNNQSCNRLHCEIIGLPFLLQPVWFYVT